VSTASDDESDLALAIDGDGEAFGRIFDRHRSRLYRHSFRLVPVPADADDVVAVVFLEAWRRRASIRFIDRSILPWLLLTATNVAHNLNRASRRHRALLERLPADPHILDHEEGTDDGEAQEALRTLSLNDQQVITLCVLYGMSEREAALALGVPPGTVKSRLSRARARLARRLETRATSTSALERSIS
jgi:RNA polymerase sigma-70 factor (ECF subfamily)